MKEMPWHVTAGNLVGDSLLAAAFVSYAAPFTMEFRKDLVQEKWLPDLQQRAIPITAGCQPIELLATDTDKVSNSDCHQLLTSEIS